MSSWNGKRFSVYTSEEKSALGLIKELGEQTNYNTDELEQMKKSDNKKVSYDDLHTKYQLTTDGTNANFNGTWQGLKRPTLSQEGAFAQVEKNADDIKEISSQLETSTKKGYYGGKSNLSPYFNKSCAFAWVDDDGSKGFLTTLKPLLESKGMKCTLGVITDRIGTDSYLSKTELLELQENGYEIVSHSASHSSSIFKDDLAISELMIEKDLKKSQDWLLALYQQDSLQSFRSK